VKMDEIIKVNNFTWDNRSNDVFGLCANHLFISYQLYNFLSIRKLKKALDEGLIYPVTESLVVAITDLCDSKNTEHIYEKYLNMSFKDRLSTRKTRTKTEDYSSILDWTGN